MLGIRLGVPRRNHLHWKCSSVPPGYLGHQAPPDLLEEGTLSHSGIGVKEPGMTISELGGDQVDDDTVECAGHPALRACDVARGLPPG